MGIRYVTGSYDGGEERTVMVDSITDTAFGPLFDSEEAADSFVAYCQRQLGACPRNLSPREMETAVASWRGAAAPTWPAPDAEQTEGRLHSRRSPEAFHHPGSDKIGHLVSECSKRGCAK